MSTLNESSATVVPFARRIKAEALPWWWTASLIALALAMAAFRLAHTEADPDLWGHLRFGLDLLDTGRVDRPDIYSYLTTGVRWINHEWLSELLMAIAYRAAGPTGLIALKTMLGLGVAVLAAHHLRRRERLSLLAALFITAYGMLMLYPGIRPMRPQAFTYLGAAAVLWLMEGSAARSPERHARAMWWAVPVMAIWVNAHGGFVAGVGMLGLWWGSRALLAFMEGHANLRPLAFDGLAVVAAIAATLINPYGWDMWTFLARTLVPRPEIVEWQAVPIQSREGLAYLLVVALGLFGLRAQTMRRRILTAPIVLTAILLPLTARRHVPLLVIIVLFTCAGDAARALGAFVAKRWPRMEKPSSGRLRPLIAAGLIVEAIVILALAGTEWTRITVDREGYPIAIVDRLSRISQRANVAVFFDWGEYVLWHVGPRIKVSVDGRRETVYPDPIYAANGAFTDGIGDWERLLRDHPTDLALVDVDTPAASLMALKPDWELIVRDGPAALYSRRGSALSAALRAVDVAPVGPQVPGDPAEARRPPLTFP